MINGHGNNIYQYDRKKIKIDFSSNVAYNNKSDLILEYLKNELDCIKNYPDPNATKLTQQIATHYHAKEENILVTNGSAEAFYILAHWLATQTSSAKKCKSLVFTPSFAEYEDSCALFSHELEYKNLLDFSHLDYTSFDSVWLCSPNNPDGYRVKAEEIKQKCQDYPLSYFLLDRAYNELSSNREYEDGIAQNLICIHSLTKSFGIPGLRLGFILAHENIINKINTMRAPWTVNALAIKAGEYIMQNYEKLLLNQEQLIEESLFLQEEIKKIPLFEVEASSCNFFLCKISEHHNKAEKNNKDVKNLSKYLREEHGILIRDASNFRSLDERYFRLAAQKREDNIILLDALKKWIK